MGAPVPCSKRDDPRGRVGSEVTLRRGELVTIRSCATPVREPRTGKRCEGAWWVEGLKGVGFALPKSKVRERQRPQRPSCPDWNRDFGRELGGLLDRGIRTVGEAAEGLSEVLPRGDLPFPHREGGHRCCWRHAEHEQAREVFARVGALEQAARERATDQVLWDWTEAGEVETGTTEEDLGWHRREMLRERVEELVRAELAAEPGYAEALEHEKHCSDVWYLWIDRALPAFGTYRGELAALKRKVGAGLFPEEDVIVGEVSDLRAQYEIGSTSPLVGEWFSWSEPEKRQEELEYQERRRFVRGERKGAA